MILVETATNEVKAVTTGDAKSRLNKFKGWACGAGMDFLWINSSGYIFGNVCRHSGCYGNIYNDFKLPQEPMICPADSCYCAADLKIPKTKDIDHWKNFKQIIASSKDRPIQDIDDNDVIQSMFGKDKTTNTFQINWNLGKRCNYNCSYCPSSVHDNHSPHMPFDKFKTAFDSIYEQAQLGNIKITFTGGEPTINPDYSKIVDYCVSKQGVRVFTNTNGTATKHKLLTYTDAGGIYLSIHSEYTQLDKIYEKIKYVAENKKSKAHLVIKIMLPLDFDDSYIEFVNKCKQIDKEWVDVNVEPLVDKSHNNKIYPYTDKQIQYIRTLTW